MRSSTGSTVLLSAALLFFVESAATNPRGNVTLDVVAYPEDPLFADQYSDLVQSSFSAHVDWAKNLSRGMRFDLSARGRVSSHADDTLFGDIKEGNLRFRAAHTDFKVGIIQENWSVLEAWNPVDIVNQRDMVEDFQGDVKLGQPGLAATTFYKDLVLSASILPYSRKRRIAEHEDRLRTLPAPILDSVFEHGQSDSSVTFRAQYRLGDFDMAVSQYIGHSREPIYQPVIEQQLLLGFDEFYENVAQTGLELQYVLGDTVLKGEIINQTGGVDSFVGGGLGSETTFNQVTGRFDSISLYVEGYYDAREESAPVTPFQRDVYVGIRYNTNDVHDSLIDFRFTHDLEFHSNMIDVRASRRMGEDQTLLLQLLAPLSVTNDPALMGYEQDKYIKLSWSRYF